MVRVPHCKRKTMKKPNERMEEAKLSELAPGFDKELEWNRLNEKLRPSTAIRPIWKVAAAVLILLSVGFAVVIFTGRPQGENSSATIISDTPANWAKGVLPEMPAPPVALNSNKQRDRVVVAISPVAKAQVNKADTTRILKGLRRTGEFVCNSTPCPIEICITQTLKCKEIVPSAVKSCSILDPDQARQLRFNNPQAAGKNCSVSVSEITIERVATGEMIVLNDNSPSTAQQLFSCLTGNMECNMLAGIFKSDCDNHQRPDKLNIEKNAGSIILE